MPSKTVNEAFDEIFSSEETSHQSQQNTTQPINNNGFFLNENDVKFVNGLSSKKSDLMTKIINTEAIKQTITKVGICPTDEEVLIVDAILAEIDNQANLFSEQLGDDTFKNFLSGRSHSLQLTGCRAN
jgi:RNA processing factor Prp31